jgi:hypothetical protein
MLKPFLRHRFLLLLVAVVLVLKLVSQNESWVESGYTYGVYPVISRMMRFLTGWLPFSLGDLLYFAAGLGVIRFIWRSIRAMHKTGIRKNGGSILYKLLQTVLLVSILFNVLWGLNYNRQGIAHQLGLQVQRYDLKDAVLLTQTLQTQLNHFAAQVDTIKRNRLDANKELFQKAIKVYDTAVAQFPFLSYKNPSIKPSLYSGVGHYIGFTGYYNPFSGEAQIKTSIPVFLKPFVATHEIAHQLGYAKENEANFVAFLSSKSSRDVDFLYSTYYHLYAYAVREVYSRDSTLAKAFRQGLHPQVLRDNEILKAYFRSTENRIEPLITRFYDQYLKWNNQKAGVQTYNQVVALLVAYGKKRGWSAI